MATIAVKDEAEWLSLRESYVGGSEIASLFYKWRLPDGSDKVYHLWEQPPEGSICLGCLSPYTTGYALHTHKAGKVMPSNFSSERMDAGTFLEPALAEWSRKKFQWPIRKVRRYHTHESVEGWGASADYEIHGGGVSGVPVEFKNVDGYLFRTGEWGADNGEIVSVPLHIMLQLQHQIGALDAKEGWIVCCVGGNELLRGSIPRHEPTQERIASAVTAFWSNVRAGHAPEHLADYEAVAEEFAVGVKSEDVAKAKDPATFDKLCEDYLRVKAHVEEIETSAEILKGQIALQIGENNRVASDGYKVTWPVIHRPAKIIPAREQTEKSYRGGMIISKKG